MDKVGFIFGVHAHQPIGNFGWVFDDALDMCYLPFFRTLKEFPRVKCCVHISGPILDWLLITKRDELIHIIRELVERQQVEFLSGGYYEPILPLISRHDAKLQISRTKNMLKEIFDCKNQPQGFWLAERVWEPQLVSLLCDCGIKYTFLDDYHFERAGVRFDDIIGRHYLTEDQGKNIAVFSISKLLRYKIPFAPVAETISILRKRLKQDSKQVVVCVDDAEKFGIWPGTQEHVYDNKWLEKFFQALSENAWIETIHPSEVYRTQRALGPVYFPNCSYEEMGKWTLDAEDALVYESIDRKFCKSRVLISGGYFRNYFSLYPESNYMHKRMLYTSDKATASKNPFAINHTLMAQCNCAYWHGVFGGLYLPYLRRAIYEHLLRAQRKIWAKNAATKKEWIKFDKKDFNSDGQDELIIETERLFLVVAVYRGGRLLEFSDKAYAINIGNTLARRPEAYHEKCKDSSFLDNRNAEKSTVTIHEKNDFVGLSTKKYLVYDNDLRNMLKDSLCVGKNTDGTDNINFHYVPFKHQFVVDHKRKTARLVMKYVDDVNDTKVCILKTLIFNQNEPYKVRVCYDISGSLLGDLGVCILCTELNIALSSEKEPNFLKIKDKDRLFMDAQLSEMNGINEVKGLCLQDTILGYSFVISSSEVFSTKTKPIYTVSSFEGGVELHYQQTEIKIFKQFDKKSKTKSFYLDLSLEESERV